MKQLSSGVSTGSSGGREGTPGTSRFCAQPASAQGHRFHPAEMNKMEKPQWTSCIPRGCLSPLLPLKGEGTGTTDPSHALAHCGEVLWRGPWLGLDACMDPCPGQRLVGYGNNSVRLHIFSQEILSRPAVRCGRLGRARDLQSQRPPEPGPDSAQLPSEGGQAGREHSTAQPGQSSDSHSCGGHQSGKSDRRAKEQGKGTPAASHLATQRAGQGTEWA